MKKIITNLLPIFIGLVFSTSCFATCKDNNRTCTFEELEANARIRERFVHEIMEAQSQLQQLTVEAQRDLSPENRRRDAFDPQTYYNLNEAAYTEVLTRLETATDALETDRLH